MKQFSLAIVVDRYWPSRGGVEMAAQSLAASLPKEWEIMVITHRPADGSTLYGTFTANNKIPENDPFDITITPLDRRKFGRLLMIPLLVWNIPFIRSRRPRALYDALYYWYKLAFSGPLSRLLDGFDAVHCISTNYLARCVSEVCLSKGIPLVHNPFIHFGRWGDSPAQLRAYAQADTVICPTKSFEDRFINELDSPVPPHVTVIPPVTIRGGHPKLRMPPVPGRFVLFLGRREAHKGLAALLVAFNGLEDLASLVIAGPGKKVRIRNPAVFDLGEVEDRIKDWLLSSCDILCVPTTNETFGIVFTEAMSYGKPVVGYDIAPVNEIVVNGETGILVSPDETEHLHEALRTLLSEKALRKKMGESALEHFREHFSRKKIIDQIIRLHWKQVVEEAPSPQQEPVVLCQ
jgi:glycosyltransferase involved in cell wall biosynthesis